MRIIGGRFRGRRLAAFRGKSIRPLLDSVREALFNILGDRVEGAHVLDLFCGSGSFGLEALSRGAESCDFVELDGYAVGILRGNLEALGVETRARVHRRDVFRFLARPPAGPRARIAFLDPPYRMMKDVGGRERWRRLLAGPALASHLDPAGICIVHLERDAPAQDFGAALVLHEIRDYGRSRLHFVGPRPDAGSDQSASGQEDL